MNQGTYSTSYVDNSVNLKAKNFVAENYARIGLLIMEGNRLRWFEAQRRHELKEALSAPKTAPEVVQAPAPTPISGAVLEPTVESKSPDFQRVSLEGDAEQRSGVAGEELPSKKLDEQVSGSGTCVTDLEFQAKLEAERKLGESSESTELQGCEEEAGGK